MNNKLKKNLKQLVVHYQLKKNNETFIPFFRVSIGIIVLLLFFSFLKDFDYLYGLNSIIPSDIHTVTTDNYFVFYNDIVSFFTKFSVDENIVEAIFKILFVIFCLFIIIGFYSRVFSILLLFLFTALIKSSHLYSYGVDYYLMISLFYISILPSDDYFSVRRKKTTSSFIMQQRTFQIHICIAYFVSGLEKISGYNWRNGEAVWKAIHLPNFTNDFNINIDFLGNYPFIFVFLSWYTIVVELFYPVFILNSKTRMLWLYLIILLHIGIAIFLNLYFFAATLIIWNLSAFYFQNEKNI